MITKHIIFGVPDGGLFLARQIKRHWQDSIIYAIGMLGDIGQYSKCIDLFYGISSNHDLDSTTKKAYNDIGGGTVFAYFGSNPMLEWVIENHPDFFDFLTFENPYSYYRNLVNKLSAAALCDNCGVRMPKEYSLSNNDFGHIIFPVVIKPLKKMVDVPIKKCNFISSAQALQSFLNIIDSNHANRSNLICQQAIRGNNRWEYGYGGYFINGEPQVDICFHQFRQHPQGLSTYIREMTDEKLCKDIKIMLRPLLQTIKANGFIQFDIKQDSETKLLYLLDINPRPWRSADMLSVKLGNSTIFSPQLNDKKVEWIYPLKSLFSKSNPNNVPKKQCVDITGDVGFTRFVSLKDEIDPIPSRQQRKKIIRAFLKKIF